MADYVTDFSGYTVGAQPSDWAARWVTASNTWAVRSKSGVQGGKTLEHTSTADGRHSLSWDAVDGDTDRADTEILARVRTNGTVGSAATLLQVQLVVRGSGTSGAESGYLLNFSSSAGGGIRLSKYVSGALTNLGTEFTDFTWSSATWYYLRFRVNGSNLYAKIWRDGEVEPTDWQTTATDTAITAAGWVGVGNFETSGTSRDFDWIKVSTAGGSPTVESDPTSEIRIYQAKALTMQSENPELRLYQAKMLTIQSEVPEFRLYQGKMLTGQNENPELRVYQMRMLIAVPFLDEDVQQPRLILGF